MRILILGGTQFLGRHIVEVAMAKRHEITLFNRGKTNPQLFPETETLIGDRNGSVKALTGRRWDALIDTSGFVSVQVRNTATLLANSVAHYTFISSASVYRDFSRPGLDESSPVAELPQGSAEDENDGASYGARKARCEQVVETIMPGKVLNVRPGIIVGPHDTTGRFTYWVRRIAAGGEVVAPGDPEASIQLIDVRDLASWILQMVEGARIGT